MSINPLPLRCPEILRQFMNALDNDHMMVQCILAGTANTVMLACGKLSGGEYIAGLSIVFGVYGGAKAYIARNNSQDGGA